jgi:hypothetical protein
LKKNHNTGTNFYTSIVHNTSIPVLRSPSTGDPENVTLMLGSITRDPIFCSKARILLQVKNIVFMSLMITKRLLDVVSCEFKKKCLKKGGHVEALKVQ